MLNGIPKDVHYLEENPMEGMGYAEIEGEALSIGWYYGDEGGGLEGPFASLDDAKDALDLHVLFSNRRQ